MKRKFYDGEVSQNSKTGYLSATDLFRIGNKYRASKGLGLIDISEFFRTKNVREFMSELEKAVGDKIKITARGRGRHTWVHPYLFIDMALALDPKFKIKVYSWIYDNLLKYRNDSGDSYKKMAGALITIISNKSTFPKVITKIANKIKKECDVKDWQTATEYQLKLRDKIHEYIFILSDVLRDVGSLVDIAIEKAKKEIECQ
jgi:hypothetical protein